MWQKRDGHGDVAGRAVWREEETQSDALLLLLLLLIPDYDVREMPVKEDWPCSWPAVLEPLFLGSLF